MTDALPRLRARFAHEQLDGFLVPVNDEFMGEYVPACAKRLGWLTGFTGSAGLAIVLKDKTAFFTDGRYTLQAKAEVHGFELHNSSELPPEKWLAQNVSAGAAVGYDPQLHTLGTIRRYEQAAPSTAFRPVLPNLIDAVWEGKPLAPASVARIQPMEYAGETSDHKRVRIGKEIAAKAADAAIITASDSLCWLLNIRGSDVPFTPFILAYAILYGDGAITVFIDKKRIPAEVLEAMGRNVTLKPKTELEAALKALTKKRVLYDPAHSPIWFYQQLKQAEAVIVESADPCQLPKACKNKAEREGVKQAHIIDGLAETRFLHWLDQAMDDGTELTEIDVAQKLESFRKQRNSYREPSFTTISGSGPNGAIVHYSVTPQTNRKLDRDSMLLLDSGGQYLEGTTDITRTIAIGTPSAEMKTNFTRVLKGHIALARAVFPEGTSGSQLDALARQYLWQAGLDYDHGTGHGVGSYLSVHEGPQRISKRGGDAPLMPGMVVSNEPGYYKAGEYGIRIENLVMVVEKGNRFLGFETLTLVPIDLRLVDATLLTTDEAQWLKDYHRKVYNTHAASLDEAAKGWLQKML